MPILRRPSFYILLCVSTVIGLMLLGLGLRLFDLTDQPIDFHPTRQLRSAIIARGIYYQLDSSADPETRQLAQDLWKTTGQYEPSILEGLVALSYLAAGQEILWVSRLFTAIFWLVGGLGVFSLARRGSSLSGALAALAYYLVLPLAVQASRSFQPDPGMVMWMVLSAYYLYRWSEDQEQGNASSDGKRHTWRWAVLAGLFGGIAILTKFVAAYMLGGLAAVMVIYSLGWKNFWRSPQVWAMAALMILPALIFYLGRQGRASDYFQDWTVSLSHLLIEPQFYVRWFNLVQSLMGMTILLLSLTGVIIARKRYRVFLLGLWIGYGIYGLFLPYQMYTHSYYHLQLIPVVALSLAPVAELIFHRIRLENKAWQTLFAVILLVALVFPAWTSIINLSIEDYRLEPAHWQAVAAKLPTDGGVVALTQEYGFPLTYYGWRKVSLWPNRGEIKLSSLRGREKEFEEYFQKRTEGRSYFLITAFKQFNDQPDLMQALESRYPVLAEGEGYLIYDLRNPLPSESQP